LQRTTRDPRYGSQKDSGGIEPSLTGIDKSEHGCERDRIPTRPICRGTQIEQSTIIVERDTDLLLSLAAAKCGELHLESDF
jgi:hypothetical protein